MMGSLRQNVESYLGHPIKAVVVTWPRMRALYQEDILDALEHVGLESVQMPKNEQLQREGRIRYSLGNRYDPS